MALQEVRLWQDVSPITLHKCGGSVEVRPDKESQMLSNIVDNGTGRYIAISEGYLRVSCCHYDDDDQNLQPIVISDENKALLFVPEHGCAAAAAVLNYHAYRL
jgi:hypothetical protein